MVSDEHPHLQKSPSEEWHPSSAGDSEKRYRLILDSSLDAIITIDRSGLIIDWNGQAHNLFGWNEAEVVGKSMADFIVPPHLREAHDRGMQRFLSTGKGPILGRRIGITALRRGGMEFPVELTITPAKIGGSWIFTAFIRDLTEQKAAEDRICLQIAATRVLSESQSLQGAAPALLDAILERMPWDVGALWVLDRDIDVLRCVEMRSLLSDSFEAFAEQSRTITFPPGVGLPGRVWESAAPLWLGIRDADMNFPRLDTAAKAGLMTAFAFPIFLDKRVLGIFEFFSVQELKENGEIVNLLLSVGRQLAQFLERKNAERTLLENERFLESIYNGAEEAIFVVDVDKEGRFIIVGNNPAYLRLAEGFGFDATVMKGKSTRELSRFFPEEAVTGLEARYRACAESQVPMEYEETVPIRGKPTHWLTRLAPLVDETGKTYRLIGTSSNITRQKEDADKIRDTEDQLRQSQKMEAVGRLAGGVAHDFNNLLTAINGYSSMGLNMISPKDPLYEILEEINRSGNRAAGLTSQLLAFSRKQMLLPKILNLNDIVSDMETLLHRLIGEDIELVTFRDPNLRMIRMDPNQMEHVILNLALNARDAMPQGGRLMLETSNVVLSDEYSEQHPETLPGPHVLLTVSDTGTGMSPEVKGQLFEPFFTTKEIGKGTGLGLSSVYGCIKQSGGNIMVYSEVGHGSTFKVYLPVVEAPPDEKEPSPAKQTIGKGGNEHILLVEDDASVRKFIIRALTDQGYSVIHAASGTEAESLAGEAERLDLLLTDVVMPGIGGVQLAEKIRTNHPHAKVLFMSGYTENTIFQWGILKKDAAFLQKPFTGAALLEKIREILTG